MRTILILGLTGAIAIGPPLSLTIAQERSYCGRAVEMLSAHGCAACAMVRSFFARYGIAYRELSVGPLWNAPPRGVPQVTIDGARSYGFDESLLRQQLCIRR